MACGLPTLDEDIKNIIVGMEAAYTQDSLSGPSSRPLNHMCQVKIHGMELFDPCECRNHVGSMFSSPATSKLGPLRTKLTSELVPFGRVRAPKSDFHIRKSFFAIFLQSWCLVEG